MTTNVFQFHLIWYAICGLIFEENWIVVNLCVSLQCYPHIDTSLILIWFFYVFLRRNVNSLRVIFWSILILDNLYVTLCILTCFTCVNWRLTILILETWSFLVILPPPKKAVWTLQVWYFDKFQLWTTYHFSF